MNIYLNNLKELKKYNPMLAKKIEDTKVKKYELIKTDGKYNIYDKEKKQFLYYEKKVMKNIEYDIKKLKIEAAKIAVFLGFGLSYEYNVFIENYSKKHKTEFLIIIEKDIEIFKLCMQVINLEMFFKNNRIKFFVGEEVNSLYADIIEWVIRNKMYYYTKALAFIYSNKYIENNIEYYKKAIQMIKDVVTNAILRFGDSAQDSLKGERNMFKNLEYIIKNPGINMLYNKFKDIPAVIVSSGPSLNKNKHLLKDVKNKALILCPEASLRVLQNENIKPNFATSLEREIQTVEVVKDFKEGYLDNVYLAASPVIMKETYDAYKGPKIIVYRQFDHFKWLELDKGMLDIKLSAGNMAFKVADVLGCNPIILIGQDLAFSRDGSTHAKGMDYGEDQRYTEPETFSQVVKVKANYGEDIETIEVWKRFMKGYEVDILKYKGICINSTEGGAYIEGTKVDTFQNSIDKYIADREEVDFDSQIKEYLSDFSTKNVNSDYNHIMKKMDIAVDELNSIQEKYFEIIKLVEENNDFISDILNNNEVKEKGNIINIFSKYKGIENYVIDNYINTLQLLVMHVIQAQYIQFQNDVAYLDSSIKDRHLMYAKVLSLARKFYKDYIKVLEIIKQMLIEEKQELSDKKEEFEV